MGFLDILLGRNENTNLRQLNIQQGIVEDAKYLIQQLGEKTNTFERSDAANVSTVFACIQIKADTLARLPLDIAMEDTNGRRVLRDNPLYYVLHYQPNGYTTSYNFWWAMEFYRNLKGNSYAKITRNQAGGVDSLTLIHPDDVVGYSIYNNQVYYVYHERNLKGEPKETPSKLSGADMLHFTFGTVDGIMGIDPISKLMTELGIKVKASKTLDYLYTNNALNKALVLPNINNEATKKQIEDFNNHSGVINTGKLRQLPYGSQLVDMSLDLNAVQFIESQKFTVTQIAALYRVPAHMLGIMEQSKFNSVEAMTLDFKSSSVAPIAKQYKRQLESKLLTRSQITSGMTIEFNTNALIETDLDTKNKIITDQVMKGLISPNYAAGIYGYPEWEGGQNHWMPSSSMFAEIRAKSDEEKLKGLVNENEDNDNDDTPPAE